MKRILSLALTVLLTALLAGLTAILLPGTASAHSSLENSSPAVGAELAEAPTSIVLVFNEGIRDFAPQIAITVGSQAPVSVTPTVDVDTVVADLTGVEIPRDPASVLWKVGYRVVSEDGHPVAGVLEFSVLDEGAPAASGSVGGAPTVDVTTEAATTDGATTEGPADSTEAPATVSDEPMMSIMETSAEPSAPGTATEPTADTEDGHSTTAMIGWFVGGGILIIAIIAVAVIAARRRPAGGRSDRSGGGDGDSGSDSSSSDSGGSDSGGGGGGD